MNFGLDWIVHTQFSFADDFNLRYILTRHLPLFPTLFAIIYFTNMYRKMILAQLAMFIISMMCGVLVVYYTTDKDTFGMMKRTPGLTVL